MKGMKGVVQKIYHNSYTFSFFVVIVLFHRVLSISVSTLSSSETLTISSNRTLVSRGGVFELGFFKPSERSRWYLGIWYKQVTEKTYAWVANRDNPLTNSTGALEIYRNNLVLLDQLNKTVWTTNLPSGDAKSPLTAELLANGNFVLRNSSDNNDDPSEFLWQSFDFPTDTLLPGMKLGYDFKTERNRFLTSWAAEDDPTSGDFTFKLNFTRKPPEFLLLMNQDWIIHRGGPRFGIPAMQGSDYTVYNFTENNEEIAFSFLTTNHSIYSRLIMRDSKLMEFTWIPPSSAWKPSVDSVFKHICDLYLTCGGPNTYCDENTSPICNCITGYVPKNDTAWAERDERLGLSSGCVRKELNCQGQHRFFQLNNTKLPDTKTATVDRRIDMNTCKERCLSDCNCTSFAFGTAGLGCVTWTGDLVDIRTYNEGGNVLYVKVSADDDADSSSGEKSDRTGKIIGLTIGGFSVMLTLIVIFFCFWKRRDKQAKADATPIVANQVLMNEVVLPRKKRNLFGEEDEVKDLKLPLMEFEAVVAATQHFSDVNKVGKGGFGIVYKV
ncbi:hypothetical protein Bca4012_081718 [Brassica carinata]